ncbi:MAG: hypothetical protein ACYTF1_03880 [Planctomycetota bacterium]|jgi:hypothetical protein
MQRQVSASKARARRRWVIRSTVTLILTAAVLFLFIIWRRDQMTIEVGLRKFNDPVKALQNKIDSLKMLPALLPEMSNLQGAYYALADERRFAMNTSEPTIIAFGQPTHLFLGQDGLCVIIYHQGKVSAKWMNVTEFFQEQKKQKRKIKAFEKEFFSKPPELP